MEENKTEAIDENNNEDKKDVLFEVKLASEDMYKILYYDAMLQKVKLEIEKENMEYQQLITHHSMVLHNLRESKEQITQNYIIVEEETNNKYNIDVKNYTFDTDAELLRLNT